LSGQPIPGTRPLSRTGAGRSRVPYLALHPMGFSVPRRLRFARCALAAPFHHHRQLAPEAVCFLWHCPSESLSAFRPRVSRPYSLVTRHRALWCSDFPLPARAGSDSPPFQNQSDNKRSRRISQARRLNIVIGIPQRGGALHRRHGRCRGNQQGAGRFGIIRDGTGVDGSEKSRQCFGECLHAICPSAGVNDEKRQADGDALALGSCGSVEGIEGGGQPRRFGF
jgi:hypothetical protein